MMRINGVEAMDIVDEKGDTDAVIESDKEEEISDVTMTTAHIRPKKKYELYSAAPREMFFHFNLLQLMSVRAAALKAGVKETTVRYWLNKYVEDPDNFVIGKTVEQSQ
ncbi:hypothetical protein BDF21DRAFT_427519 [Thamnidium elegans]|nr:hypothetical protein BDF21DRAFT_427519 [Thamnidium elegans]